MLELRRLVRNFASTAGLRVAAAAVSFVFFVLLARSWGSAELGEFATVFAFLMVLQQVPLLGLHVPIIRDLAKHPESLEELGPSAAAIALGTAVVLGFLLGLVAARFYPERMHAAFWLVGVSLVPGALVVVAESVLIAQERVARVAAIGVGENLARASVSLVLVSLGYGLTALFLALAIIRGFTFLAYYGSRNLRPVLHLERCRPDVIRGLLALCPTFVGILILAVAINRMDFIMLSTLGSLEQVGLYAAPYKVYEMALMVPSVLTQTLFPSFAMTFAVSRRRLDNLVRQFLRLCLTLGLPCAVTLGFIAVPLVVALFGPAFRDAADVLVILSIVPVLLAADQALGMMMLASGQERLDLRVLICACSYYAIALCGLIPTMGIRGAALATASAALVQVAVRYYLVRTRLRTESMASLASRPILAGLLMAASVWAMRSVSLAGALVLGNVVYAATLAALRAVTRADLQWIRAALQRPREAA